MSVVVLIHFYEVAIADRPRLQEYLRRAHELGKNYAVASPAAAAPGLTEAA